MWKSLHLMSIREHVDIFSLICRMTSNISAIDCYRENHSTESLLCTNFQLLMQKPGTDFIEFYCAIPNETSPTPAVCARFQAPHKLSDFDSVTSLCLSLQRMLGANCDQRPFYYRHLVTDTFSASNCFTALNLVSVLELLFSRFSL